MRGLGSLGVIAALILAPSLEAQADEPGVPLSAHVTRVVDGDTLHVRLASGDTIVSLHGIDAPESDQDYGAEATEALRKMVDGRDVELDVTAENDAHDRIVAIVYRGDLNVNLAMVKHGFAWAARKYMRKNQDESLCAAEDLARENRRGLWGELMSEVAPWEWRHRRTLLAFTHYTSTSTADCVAEIGK